MTYTSERTPILGGNSPHASNSNASKKSWISRVVHFFGGGIFTPTASTYDPIEVLLNTKDADERDRLTQRWKDNKVSELNFVGIVVCYDISYPSPPFGRPVIMVASTKVPITVT